MIDYIVIQEKIHDLFDLDTFSYISQQLCADYYHYGINSSIVGAILAMNVDYNYGSFILVSSAKNINKANKIAKEKGEFYYD